MRRDRLGFARTLEHEELREDSDGFEEDGERPEDLGGGEGVVEDEGEDGGWAEEVFDAEGVDGRVVGWSRGKDSSGARK